MPFTTRGDIEGEARCMSLLFQEAPEVSVVYEAFGGHAVTSRVLARQMPFARFIATDHDQACVDSYNRAMAPRGECLLMDAMEGARVVMSQVIDSLGISLDFDRFTLRDLTSAHRGRRAQLVEQVLGVGCHNLRWVQITDSAVRYLHLNAYAYGLTTDLPPGERRKSAHPPGEHLRRYHRLVEYTGQLEDELHRRWGWTVARATYQYSASYLLLTRDERTRQWTMQRG